MKYVQQLTQAYSQTPWRKQIRGIGFILIIVVMTVLAASIFMSITARSAVVGRQIQMNRIDITDMQREIADMESELARLSSIAVLKERAREMGFRPAKDEDITYVQVSSIVKHDEARLGASTQPTKLDPEPVLSPAFTQTWTDWLFQNFKKPVVPLADVQP
mgnify:CR=1 FL=1